MVRLDSLPVGRASLTLPWAILRITVEKAGAGMCRIGFFVPNKRPPGGRVGRGPCTRHEAHGRRTRPLRDFVAGAPTSSVGGPAHLLLSEISFELDAVFSFSFCGEDEIRTRGTVNPYVSLANWWFQPLTHLSGNALLREIR